MTTKIVTGTYAAGYSLQSPVTTLSIASSGYIAGSGVTTAAGDANAYDVVNLGRIVGADTGVSLAHGGTLFNFGAIVGSGTTATSAGVYLGSAGAVANGAATDINATITGYRGVVIDNGVGVLTNFGTITGVGGFYNIAAVYLGMGGKIINGNASDSHALMQGNNVVIVRTGAGTLINDGTIAANPQANYVAVNLAGGGVVSNLGTISSGGSGVNLAGGRLVNGSASDTRALIESFGVGVYLGVQGGAIQNFGSILSRGQVNRFGAGVLSEGAIRLTNGAAGDTTARIQGYSGVNFQGAGVLINFGTVVGIDMFGAGATLQSGGDITNGAADDTGALIEGHVGVSLVGAGVLTNFGTIAGEHGGDAVLLTSAHDTLVVEAGSRFIGAVVGGGGTLDLASGSGTISSAAGGGLRVTVGAAVGAFSGFATVDVGLGAQFALTGALTISGGGLLAVSSPTLLIAGGAVLSGGGRLYIGAASAIDGETGSSKLVNVEDTIYGGGQLGGGRMVLVNDAKGVIHGDLATALTINTGANLVVNSGLIEATGAGGVIIVGAIDNAGTLYADGGNLTVDGAVSNLGAVRINAATADFAAAFRQNVTFAATGVLELAQSQTYTGTIAGFSKTGTTSLDLGDIAFGASTKSSFSGAATSGVLTVTDGTHTARITLAGDYAGSAFVVSSDGHGGTTVVDPSSAPNAPVHAFVAGMASLGGAGEDVIATRAYSPLILTSLVTPTNA